MPVVGFLRSASLTDASHLVAGFRQGLTMMLSSKTFRASWSIGLAAALVAAVPPGRMARAENIVGGTFAPHLLDAAQARAPSGICERCRTSPLRVVATEPPAPSATIVPQSMWRRR